MKKEIIKQNIIQFIKFGIVGISNTVLYYCVYVVTIFLLRQFNFQYDYIIGNIIGFIISVFWSFCWNNKCVFVLKENETRSFGKALIKTYISYFFSGVVLFNILSWLWISVLEISKFIAPIFTVIITAPINFILNKTWAFRKREKNA